MTPIAVPEISPAPAGPVSDSVTTLAVFTFGRRDYTWAFSRMAMARPLLLKVPGMRFHRLMGTGQGLGFTLEPNFSRYALLAVWETEAQGREFLASSPFMQHYRQRAAREATAIVRPYTARGAWGGSNPFLPVNAQPPPPGQPVGVLTRAAIRPTRLGTFWKHVPAVSARLGQAPGLISSIGMGEAPFLLQVTFSIWESADAVRRFAYESPEHRQAVVKTKQERWFKEDLFARFAILEKTLQFP